MQCKFEMRERDLRDGCVHIVEACELGTRERRVYTCEAIMFAVWRHRVRVKHGTR